MCCLLTGTIHLPNMYGPPFDCKEKAEGEKLRAYLSLLIGRLLSTNIPLLDLLIDPNASGFRQMDYFRIARDLAIYQSRRIHPRYSTAVDELETWKEGGPLRPAFRLRSSQRWRVFASARRIVRVFLFMT